MGWHFTKILFHWSLKHPYCLHFAVEKTESRNLIDSFCHYRAKISFQVCLNALVLFLPHCAVKDQRMAAGLACGPGHVQGHLAGLPWFSSPVHSVSSNLFKAPWEPLCVYVGILALFWKGRILNSAYLEQNESHQGWKSADSISSDRMLFSKSSDPGQSRARQSMLPSFVKL